MEISQIIPHIEALIFASDKPLVAEELVELVNNALGFIEDRATIEQVEAAIEGIKEKYSAEFYAFELKQSGGGLQFLTKPAYYKTVALLNGDKFLKRLSTAALETLAIIAYKQPITKSEMEAIRGVNCDYAVQKLLEKDLAVISGRREEAVGQPLLYSTSKSFMDYFGINSPADLPKISEVMMEELVQATNVQDAQEEMMEHSGKLGEETEELHTENVNPEDENSEPAAVTVELEETVTVVEEVTTIEAEEDSTAEEAAPPAADEAAGETAEQQQA
jgi:segregation and condensation protein B